MGAVAIVDASLSIHEPADQDHLRFPGPAACDTLAGFVTGLLDALEARRLPYASLQAFSG